VDELWATGCVDQRLRQAIAQYLAPLNSLALGLRPDA